MPFIPIFSLNQAFDCKNHIRAIVHNLTDDSFYICGTGAFSPKENRLDVSLKNYFVNYTNVSVIKQVI